MLVFRKGLRAAWRWTYLAAIFWLFAIVPVRAEDTQLADFPLTTIRDSDDFRYMRAVLPPDGDPAPEDFSVLQRALKEKMESLLSVYRDNRRSVAAMLATQNIAVPAGSDGAGTVGLEVLKDKDGGPVAALTADDRIIISMRTLRGFLVGAFRSGIVDNSAESLVIRMALGWRSDPGGDEETWQKRTRAYVDLIDSMEPVTITGADQKKAGAEMFDDDEEAKSSPVFFETLQKRVLENGVPLTPVETYRLIFAQMQFGMFVHGAEERFLLAHELGHLILRHAQLAPCDVAADQERDADAFAIALLTYDFSGGTLNLMMFGGEDNPLFKELYQTEAEEPDLRRMRFGYAQAFRHGMASAGMRADPAAQCTFVPPEERFGRTEAFQLAMSQRQFGSYASFRAYANARPSTAATIELVNRLDTAGKLTFTEENRSKCNGASIRLVRYENWNTAAGKPNVYYVKCNWPKPSLADVSQSDRVLIGEIFYQAMEGTYGDAGAKEVENF